MTTPAVTRSPVELPILLGRLERVRAVAEQLGVADAAGALQQESERLRAARFIVACIGQFKRGKSTLVNALLGEPILPVGVVPVTAIVTVLTFGETRQAIAHFADGRHETISVADLDQFIDDRANPDNRHGVTWVDVRLPAAILRNGLLLVDTPGLGSTIAANTRETYGFLPRVDVTLAVVGADPPISGIELDMIEAVARDARQVIVVLNKADLATAEQLADVIAFTRRALESRLHDADVPLFVVSAWNVLGGRAPAFDWSRLEEHLDFLRHEGRDAVMVASAQRVLERFCRTLRAEITRHDAALRAPLEETQSRLDRLRSLTMNIETSLRELRFLLDAAEADLGRVLESRRSAFTAQVRPDLHAALTQWLDQQVADRQPRLRGRAMEHAGSLAQRAVEQWFEELEPIVHALYVEASERFVTIVNRFLDHLSEDAEETTAADLPAEQGLRERRRFYFTHLMHVASPRPSQWAADLLGPATRRRQDILRAATRYMDRLVESNASRVRYDFATRALESRRALEAIVRRRLQAAEAAAQRALDVAIARRQLNEPAITARIASTQALATELEASCSCLTG